MCLTGRGCRWLPWTRSAARCFALLTGVVPSHVLVGPVPLWCGGVHAAAVRHASRRMGAPPPYGSVALAGPRRGRSGRVQAGARAREGPSTPSPGLGLLPIVQLVGPMVGVAPGHASIVHLRGYNEALCAKVNVREPARRKTSLEQYIPSFGTALHPGKGHRYINHMVAPPPT